MFELNGPNYIGVNRYSCDVCESPPDRFEYWLGGKFRLCEKCKDRYYREMQESNGKIYAKFLEIAIKNKGK